MLRLIRQCGKRMQNLTAFEFYQAWKKYDLDGSGFIENEEVENFLKEFLINIAGISSKEALSAQGLKQLAKEFLDSYDRDKDGKISIQELSNLLPTDQNFLLIFRFDNPLTSTEDFMQAWRKYDVDKSGYIEADEIKGFLTDVLKNQKLDAKTIIEYSKSILEIFDSNNDGKLSLGETAQLLVVTENFIQSAAEKINFGQVSHEEVQKILNTYDRDNNGKIAASEIDALSVDLLQLSKNYTEEGVKVLKEAISKGCALDAEGKIDRKEVNMIINAVSSLTDSDEKSSSQLLTNDMK
jgi:Ca2+-binding EF-hand superfamily protein